MKSQWEETFFFQCRCLKMPPAREYRWHPERKWRFDFAFPERKVAVEIEGAVWTRGRHVRGGGFIEDMEKYNEAGRLGWKVFRFPPERVKDGSAIKYVEEVLRELDA